MSFGSLGSPSEKKDVIIFIIIIINVRGICRNHYAKDQPSMRKIIHNNSYLGVTSVNLMLLHLSNSC